MTDRDRLKEALDLFLSDELPDDPTTADHDAYEIVAAAARRLLEPAQPDRMAAAEKIRGMIGEDLIDFGYCLLVADAAIDAALVGLVCIPEETK